MTDLLTPGLERLKRRQAEVLKFEEELSQARAERDATIALLLSLDESQGGPATIYGIAKALGVTRQSVMAMRDKAKTATNDVSARETAVNRAEGFIPQEENWLDQDVIIDRP